MAFHLLIIRSHSGPHRATTAFSHQIGTALLSQHKRNPDLLDMAITTTAADLLASYRPQVTAMMILCAVAWLFCSYFLREDHLSKLPLAGAEFGNTEQRRAAFIKNGKRIYMEAYHKVLQILSFICWIKLSLV